MKINSIYLDLDGVLADFVDAVARAHDAQGAHDLYPHWVPGTYDTRIALGTYLRRDISDDGMWEPINLRKELYWKEMPAYPWRDLLFNFCEERFTRPATSRDGVSWRPPVYILTSPSRHHSSSSGKVLWLQSWKGEGFRQYVLAPRKWHLSRPGALLIDDDPKNCEEWERRGGKAILFPRIWNTRHDRHERPIETVLPEILGLEYELVD